MGGIRIFLAVPLPSALQKDIAALQRDLRDRLPPVRWAHPGNLHLTLHFFGEISQEYLEKLKVSMLSVKGCQPPFSVEVKGLGAFPSPRRPRVIWLGLEPEDQLVQLHRHCMNILRADGLVAAPGPYSPHLTIGRLRQQKTDLTDLCRAVVRSPIGRLPVDRLVLYESRLRPDGALHLPLLTVTLDDTSSPQQNS